VDQSFTSAASTFNDVVDPAQVEFPDKLPSEADLAARLDREVPRLNNAIAAAAERSAGRSDTARTLAVVAIVVGGAGLLVGGTASWIRGAARLDEGRRNPSPATHWSSASPSGTFRRASTR